jgi:hypothetical protein
MGLGELAERSRQELFKRLERAGINPQPPSGPEVSLSEWRETAPARFFPGTAEPVRAVLAARWPDVAAGIVQAADKARHGRFDLLGYRDLFFGDPINWQLDPVTGRRAPLEHWTCLDPLDSATIGDNKVIWELNRHQWLVVMACAYRISNDESYADAAVSFVRGWIEANPPGRGINWASSLEAAFRLISWCWTVALIIRSPALSEASFAVWLGSIRRHALHVERYLSHYYSPNTHLTGEALGLFYAGVLFPQVPYASRWRETGARILIEQIEKQVLADGVYFEQSTYYQRYTVEIYLHFLILAGRNGVAVPKLVTERIQAMLDFLLRVRRPDGTMPEIGDADGGGLLPIAPGSPENARGLFSLAAARFGRSDYAWAGDATPDVFFLLGTDGLAALDRVPAAPPDGPASKAFPDGGYAVMRNGWDEHAHQLILDAGPLGGLPTAGHGHADLLSLECSVYGTPFLVDPGTFSYTRDTEWRNHFRSTRAHGTVTVDGIDQAAPVGPFSWLSRPSARLRHWHSADALDFADAEHDAYRHLPDPVRHRRRVLFFEGTFWLVVDDLHGKAQHRIDLRFQFAPMKVTLNDDLWARAEGPQEKALLIRPFASASVSGEVSEGLLDPPRGWVSPRYGHRRSAPQVVYSFEATLPVRVVTLLWPIDDPGAPPPAVRLLGTDSREPDGLLLEETGLQVRFAEPVFVVEHQ